MSEDATHRRVLVACKGTLGDVLPVLRFVLAFRNHALSSNAPGGLKSLDIVVLCHIDIEAQVQALIGCHDSTITWSAYPTSAQEIGKLGGDSEGQQKALLSEFSHCRQIFQHQQPLGQYQHRHQRQPRQDQCGHGIDLVIFNLFTLEAWLIATHYRVPSAAATPFAPTKTIPEEVETALEDEHPGFLTALKDQPPGFLSDGDVRLWLWRSMLSDIGDCCQQFSIDPCPLVQQPDTSTQHISPPLASSCGRYDLQPPEKGGAGPETSPSPVAAAAAAITAAAAGAGEPAAKYGRASVAAGAGEPAAKYGRASVAVRCLPYTPLVLLCSPKLIPANFTVPSRAHILGPYPSAVVSRSSDSNNTAQQPITSIGDEEKSNPSRKAPNLPADISSFLNRCLIPPVYAGFGAMDHLNTLSVREWKDFLLVFISALCQLRLPLILQTTGGSHLHTAVCQTLLRISTSASLLPTVPSATAAAAPPPPLLSKEDMGITSSHAAATDHPPRPPPRQKAMDLKGYVRSEISVLTETTDHGQLFPRCSLLCHHGGAGTAGTGFEHGGRPQIVFPMLFDQLANAECVARRGLAHNAGHPIAVTVQRLVQDIQSALLQRSPEYEQHCQLPTRASADIREAYKWQGHNPHPCHVHQLHTAYFLCLLPWYV